MIIVYRAISSATVLSTATMATTNATVLHVTMMPICKTPDQKAQLILAIIIDTNLINYSIYFHVHTHAHTITYTHTYVIAIIIDNR